MFLHREVLLKPKNDFEALFERIFKRKMTSAQIAKICWQITIAAWMQPLQYDLRCSAAKDNSITHAAAAPSNLDAATTMRSAETELQNTIELRATVSEIAAPKPDGSRRQSRKKTILKHFLKGFLKGKLLPWKLRKSTRKSLSQPGCSHSNTIYDVQLQKTIVLRMQPRHRLTLSTQGFVLRLPPQNIDHATFMQPLQCDLQPQLQETHRTTPQEQPLVAKHIEGTNRVRNDRSRTRRTHEVPFIVACSHFTRKNTRFRAPASSPKHRPCNMHAAITMRSATTASGNA